MTLASIPTHTDSLLLQVSKGLFCFSVVVIQSPFTALACFLIPKCNLLKARVIIYSRQATTVFSGRGSRHCSEIKWSTRKEDFR
jgi:hypothetical protein